MTGGVVVRISKVSIGKPAKGRPHTLAQRNAIRTAVRQMLAQVVAGDVTDIMGHRRGACRHCFGDGFRYQWRSPAEYAEALRAHLHDNGPCPDLGGGTGYSRGRAPNPDCPRCEGKGISYVEIADSPSLGEGQRMMLTGIRQTPDGIDLRFADRIAAARLIVQLDRGASGERPLPKPPATPASKSLAAPVPTMTIQVPAKAPLDVTRRPYRPDEGG